MNKKLKQLWILGLSALTVTGGSTVMSFADEVASPPSAENKEVAQAEDKSAMMKVVDQLQEKLEQNRAWIQQSEIDQIEALISRANEYNADKDVPKASVEKLTEDMNAQIEDIGNQAAGYKSSSKQELEDLINKFKALGIDDVVAPALSGLQGINVDSPESTFESVKMAIANYSQTYAVSKQVAYLNDSATKAKAILEKNTEDSQNDNIKSIITSLKDAVASIESTIESILAEPMKILGINGNINNNIQADKPKIDDAIKNYKTKQDEIFSQIGEEKVEAAPLLLKAKDSQKQNIKDVATKLENLFEQNSADNYENKGLESLYSDYETIKADVANLKELLEKKDTEEPAENSDNPKESPSDNQGENQDDNSEKEETSGANENNSNKVDGETSGGESTSTNNEAGETGSSDAEEGSQESPKEDGSAPTVPSGDGENKESQGQPDSTNNGSAETGDSGAGKEDSQPEDTNGGSQPSEDNEHSETGAPTTPTDTGNTSEPAVEPSENTPGQSDPTNNGTTGTGDVGGKEEGGKAEDNKGESQPSGQPGTPEPSTPATPAEEGNQSEPAKNSQDKTGLDEAAKALKANFEANGSWVDSEEAKQVNSLLETAKQYLADENVPETSVTKLIEDINEENTDVTNQSQQNRDNAATKIGDLVQKFNAMNLGDLVKYAVNDLESTKTKITDKDPSITLADANDVVEQYNAILEDASAVLPIINFLKSANELVANNTGDVTESQIRQTVEKLKADVEALSNSIDAIKANPKGIVSLNSHQLETLEEGRATVKADINDYVKVLNRVDDAITQLKEKYEGISEKAKSSEKPDVKALVADIEGILNTLSPDDGSIMGLYPLYNNYEALDNKLTQLEALLKDEVQPPATENPEESNPTGTTPETPGDQGQPSEENNGDKAPETTPENPGNPGDQGQPSEENNGDKAPETTPGKPGDQGQPAGDNNGDKTPETTPENPGNQGQPAGENNGDKTPETTPGKPGDQGKPAGETTGNKIPEATPGKQEGQGQQTGGTTGDKTPDINQGNQGSQGQPTGNAGNKQPEASTGNTSSSQGSDNLGNQSSNTNKEEVKKEGSKETKTPKTGDTTDLPVALALGGALGALTITLRRRKQK